MELGQRLRQARLEAGLSQRQLCGEVITRNMLSQIENGTARPSMDTLTYLAAQLGRPVSFFLEENAAISANVELMQRARSAYAAGDYQNAMEQLESYQQPDALFDDEYGFLRQLCLLSLAAQAIAQGHIPHARQLLEEAAKAETCYRLPELERRRLLLLAQISTEPISLPAEDDALLIRAAQALKAGNPQRCHALLEACEHREDANWHFLWAEGALSLKNYAQAAAHYHAAEGARPRECYSRLEQCYKALEDYKKAYEYACMQR